MCCAKRVASRHIRMQCYHIPRECKRSRLSVLGPKVGKANRRLINIRRQACAISFSASSSLLRSVFLGGLAYRSLGFMPTNADATPPAMEQHIAMSALDASMERHAPRVTNPSRRPTTT